MKTACAGIFLVALLATQTAAFSQTEFHLQYGKHKNPFSAAAAQQTFVFTVQQAAGMRVRLSCWWYGVFEGDGGFWRGLHNRRIFPGAMIYSSPTSFTR